LRVTGTRKGATPKCRPRVGGGRGDESLGKQTENEWSRVERKTIGGNLKAVSNNIGVK